MAILWGWKWEKSASMAPCPFSPILPFPLSSLPFSVSFLYIHSPEVSSPTSARKFGECCKLPRRIWMEPGRQTVSGAFRVENHALRSDNQVWFDPHWPCDVPVWYISEKKSLYGFEPAKEVPVWHTVTFPTLGYWHSYLAVWLRLFAWSFDLAVKILPYSW